MKRSILILTLILFSVFSCMHAQYISRVLEYVPAPGQHINTAWGSGQAAASIVGGISGTVSLGAFGGYIIFTFENPVENHPDNPYGVDFTIFGNPFTNWSEHGIVSVMNDENGNGLPDDTWYELAGSEYFFSSSVKDYQVSYENPGGAPSSKIPWYDNYGESGFIQTNSYHTQMYYPSADSFPAISQESYTLSGSMVRGSVNHSDPLVVRSLRKPFGYADNQFIGSAPYTVPDNPYTPEIENSGGDAFDIDWAVNQEGEYVSMEMIHFVKVHTAVLDDGGWLGEVSTEIRGAVDVSPDKSLAGANEMIVIKNLPDTISGENYLIEAYAFHNGRVRKEENIQWTADLEGVNVENNIMTFHSSGALKLTGMKANEPSVKTTISTFLNYQGPTGNSAEREIGNPGLYPNPAREEIRIKGVSEASVQVFNITGKEVIPMFEYSEADGIGVATLVPGFYIVRISSENTERSLRFLKY